MSLSPEAEARARAYTKAALQRQLDAVMEKANSHGFAVMLSCHDDVADIELSGHRLYLLDERR
jgi:lantibiotic modifying enzyme